MGWLRKQTKIGLGVVIGMLLTGVFAPVRDTISSIVRSVISGPNLDIRLQSILLMKSDEGSIPEAKLKFEFANQESNIRSLRLVYLKNTITGDSCAIQHEAPFAVPSLGISFDSIRFFAPRLEKFFYLVMQAQDQTWEIGFELAGHKGVFKRLFPGSQVQRFNFVLFPEEKVIFPPKLKRHYFEFVFVRHDTTGARITAPGQVGTSNLVFYPTSRFRLILGNPKSGEIDTILSPSDSSKTKEAVYPINPKADLISIGIDRAYILEPEAGIVIGSSNRMIASQRLIRDMLGGDDLQTVYRAYGEFVDPELLEQQQFVYIGYREQ